MSDGNSVISSSSDDEGMDLEAKRAQSTKERDDFLAQIMGDSGFSEAVEILNEQTDAVQQEALRKKAKTRRRSSTNYDSAFKFWGQIPTGERRTSQRLLKKQPDFTYQDLPEEASTSYSGRRRRSSLYMDDLEDVVYEVRQPTPRRGGRRPSSPIAVEDVTADMIRRVVTSGEKPRTKQSNLGSSCHQCRQKTLDMKTSCRSGNCVGKRGQFCGICVITRYGEDPVAALKDRNWSCYVCRGICNCSFCRLRDGKRPTGILYPMAVKYGYKSVADYLIHLKCYGDYNLDNDPDTVVGFDNDNAIMRDGRRIDLTVLGDCPLKQETPDRKSAPKRKSVGAKPPKKSPPIKKWRIKLPPKKTNNPPKKATSKDLLGFNDDFAIMGDGKSVELKNNWVSDPKSLKGFNGDVAVFSDGTVEEFKKWTCVSLD